MSVLCDHCDRDFYEQMHYKSWPCPFGFTQQYHYTNHHMRFCEQSKLLHNVLLQRNGWKTLIGLVITRGFGSFLDVQGAVMFCGWESNLVNSNGSYC